MAPQLDSVIRVIDEMFHTQQVLNIFLFFLLKNMHFEDSFEMLHNQIFVPIDCMSSFLNFKPRRGSLLLFDVSFVINTI